MDGGCGRLTHMNRHRPECDLRPVDPGL